MKCPKCGRNDKLELSVPAVSIYRVVSSGDNQITIDSSSKAMFEQDGADMGLQCIHCGEEWELSNSVEVETL